MTRITLHVYQEVLLRVYNTVPRYFETPLSKRMLPETFWMSVPTLSNSKTSNTAI